ncbi:hypothetical protein ANAPH1_00434 [Anaplasma phagocytophilum]|uniref:Uncharacterized protein n=1 Tax=Anaplasma phagocytophilum str. ApMUC09 TaxID=1359152 RepID=A0A0F3NBB6_ANAPH|nr:hypothetical protein APHMUC_1366 [Anaplasma phagocytophilum str. ApMUC09]SCV63610.1 hypothetical protein ANAPH1_00434 [Anaplasma phagocytophilum]SCV65838.1 hypothetical protein ANAPH2_01394 [Anaplasma phagocytophilum]
MLWGAYFCAMVQQNIVYGLYSADEERSSVQMGVSMGKLVSEKRDEQIGSQLVYDV